MSASSSQATNLLALPQEIIPELDLTPEEPANVSFSQLSIEQIINNSKKELLKKDSDTNVQKPKELMDNIMDRPW